MGGSWWRSGEGRKRPWGVMRVSIGAMLSGGMCIANKELRHFSLLVVAARIFKFREEL